MDAKKMADSEETKLCNNCKKQISSTNFVMHEMHCKRHILLCPHCNEPIPKNEMDAHFEESHAKTKCPKCNAEVEKMHLEEHEENSCAKKPMKCIYCELEYPKSDLQEHIDYCGSRTEACVKCGQFIMLQDQTQHHERNCQGFETQPANNTRSSSTIPANRNVADSSMNTFNADELSRIIGAKIGINQPFYNEIDVPKMRNLGQNRQYNFKKSFLIANGKSDDNKREHVRTNASMSQKNEYGVSANLSVPQKSETDKTTNQRMSQKNGYGASAKESVPRKSEYGVSTNQNASQLDEYDQLLAWQLEQDLNIDTDYVPTKFESKLPKFRGDVKYGMNHFSEDVVMIPCEFCGELAMANDLVQHQSGCSLDNVTSILPHMTTSNSRHDKPINISLGDISPAPAPSGMINILRNFGVDEWSKEDDIENMFLPCEFCQERFPSDSLIQHQAICEENMSMTPRVTTPTEAHPRSQKKSVISNANKLAADFPNLSSKRHQAPPAFFNTSDSEDNDNMVPSTLYRDDVAEMVPSTRYNSSATNTVPRTRLNDTNITDTVLSPRYNSSATDMVSSARHNSFATHTFPKPKLNVKIGISKTVITPPGSEKPKVMHNKYGVGKSDFLPRQESSFRPISDSSTDSWLQSSASQTPKIVAGSVVKMNPTFNSLLNNTGKLSHDLLGHIGTSDIKKKDSNLSHQKASVAESISKDALKPMSIPAARNQLHQPIHTSNGALPGHMNRNRSSNPNFEVRVRPNEANEVSEIVMGNQQWSRANNMFGTSQSSRSTASKENK